MTQFRLLPIYISVLLWHIGGAMAIPFTSIWLRADLNEPSFLMLALVISIPNIIGMVGVYFVSQFTDRQGYFRETILLINIVGTIEYLLLTQITKATQYLMIVGIGALVFPSFYTILQAFATNICEKNERGTVTAYLMLGSSLGWFIGASLSGVAYERIGMQWMFVIASVAFLLSGLVNLRSPQFVPNNKESLYLEATRVSTLDILRRRQIFLILLTAVIIDFSAGAMFNMTGVFFTEHIGMESELFGYSNGIATLLGTLILLRTGTFSDKYGRRPIYLLGLVVYPSLFMLLSIFSNQWAAFVIWCIPVYIFLRPVLPAMISDLTSEAERSRGMSLVTITSTIAIALGAMMNGWLVDLTGNMRIWVMIPAIAGWVAVAIGYFLVEETLEIELEPVMEIAPEGIPAKH